MNKKRQWFFQCSQGHPRGLRNDGKKRARGFFLPVIIVVVIGLPLVECAAQQLSDGTYVSSTREPGVVTSAAVREQLETFVQQTIYVSLLKKSEEYVRFAMTQQTMELFPQLVYESINQIVLQSFDQPVIQKHIQAAFTKGRDTAITRYEDKESEQSIEAGVNKDIAEALKPIFEDMVFSRVVEQVLHQALVNHRKIIVMTLAQRQMQLAAAQQRYAMLQQLAKQRYEQMVKEYFKQAAMQQQQVQQQQQRRW